MIVWTLRNSKRVSQRTPRIRIAVAREMVMGRAVISRGMGEGKKVSG
jgi:hypothetical protein